MEKVITENKLSKQSLPKWGKWVIGLAIPAITLTAATTTIYTIVKVSNNSHELPIAKEKYINWLNLNAGEFDEVVFKMNQISGIGSFIRNYITNHLDLAVAEGSSNEWTAQNEREIKEKIINKFSSNLRTQGLLETNRNINVEDIKWESFELNNNKFEGQLSFLGAKEIIKVKGDVIYGQKIKPIIEVNNDNMIKVLEESQKYLSVFNKWGFFIGLDFHGEKNQYNPLIWSGEQKLNSKDLYLQHFDWMWSYLQSFNFVALDCFPTNDDYQNFYFDTKFDKQIQDSDNNLIFDKGWWQNEATTTKNRSIVGKYDIGWVNPFDKQKISLHLTGSYIHGPVWKIYNHPDN